VIFTCPPLEETVQKTPRMIIYIQPMSILFLSPSEVSLPGLFTEGSVILFKLSLNPKWYFFSLLLFTQFDSRKTSLLPFPTKLFSYQTIRFEQILIELSPIPFPHRVRGVVLSLSSPETQACPTPPWPAERLVGSVQHGKAEPPLTFFFHTLPAVRKKHFIRFLLVPSPPLSRTGFFP